MRFSVRWRIFINNKKSKEMGRLISLLFDRGVRGKIKNSPRERPATKIAKNLPYLLHFLFTSGIIYLYPYLF